MVRLDDYRDLNGVDARMRDPEAIHRTRRRGHALVWHLSRFTHRRRVVEVQLELAIAQARVQVGDDLDDVELGGEMDERLQRDSAIIGFEDEHCRLGGAVGGGNCAETDRRDQRIRFAYHCQLVSRRSEGIESCLYLCSQRERLAPGTVAIAHPYWRSVETMPALPAGHNAVLESIRPQKVAAAQEATLLEIRGGKCCGVGGWWSVTASTV
jgi:hypothetical protein